MVSSRASGLVENKGYGGRHAQDLQVEINDDLLPVGPLLASVELGPDLAHNLFGRVDVEAALGPEPFEQAEDERSGDGVQLGRGND